MTIKFNLNLHKGQLNVLRNRKRFNTMNTGRQVGKTTLAMALIMESLGNGEDVAYFAPTYNMAMKVMRPMLKKLAPIIQESSKDQKFITTSTGGTVKFFSLDKVDTGRGETLDRVIIDECRMIRNLKEAWQTTLSATLARKQGEGYFLSTPNGPNTDWYDLCHIEDKDWAHFKLKTEDNPFIKPEEIETQRRILDPNIFAQEYEGEFINFSNMPFFYAFDKKIHVSETELSNDLDLILAFDFNFNPVTCVVMQKNDHQLIIHDVIIGTEGTRSVIDKLRHYTEYYACHMVGDASGLSRKASAKYTDFMILQNELGLILSKHQPKANASHQHQHVLINTAFQILQERIKINPKCEMLIKDLSLGELIEKDGKKNKKKDDGMHRQDAGDAFSYGMNYFFNNTNDIYLFSQY